jgi:hypothetical protein
MDLTIEIAKRVTLASTGLRPELAHSLRSRLANLSCREVSLAPGQVADIYLVESSELMPEISSSARQMLALYGFHVQYRDHVLRAFFYFKGRPIVCLHVPRALDEPLRIEFVMGKKTLGRVHTCLMYALLLAFQRRGRALLHGAVFRREEMGLVLFGQRGIGKTQLALNLLRKGWQYVADDKFLLENGVAHSYQQSLLLRDHHFQALPWLRDVANYDLRAARTRALLRRVAHQYVPEKFLPNEDRLFNKGKQYNVERLFSEAHICDQVTVTQVMILVGGHELHAEQLDPAQALETISLLQELANDEFSRLTQFLSLFFLEDASDDYRDVTLRKVLARNLPDLPFMRITVPEDCPSEALCEKIQACCPQNS